MEAPERYDLSGYRLEYFSEERARNGDPVCTKNGFTVTIHEETVESRLEPFFKVYGTRLVDNLKGKWRTNGKWLMPEFDSLQRSQNMDLYHPVLKYSPQTHAFTLK